jgi:hypothetical protein
LSCENGFYQFNCSTRQTNQILCCYIYKKIHHMKKFCTAVMLVVVLTTGCSKQSDDIIAKDTGAPIVKILGPSSLQYYKTGDPLCVVATAFDKGVVSRVSLKILKDGTGSVMHQEEFSVNEVSFKLDHKIILPSTITGNCSLLIEATDTFGNRGTATTGFSAN